MQNFMSGISGMMPGGGGGAPDDGVPWWMKYAGKGAGITSGVAAIFFGVWCCISLSPLCIVAGIWQILAGFLVIVIEAPFCCMFLDFVQKFSGMVEGRPVWQKAALYLALSFPGIFLCFGISTLVGSGLLFLTSVIYGVMTLGKNLALVPVCLCLGLSTLVGSGLIFGTSILYGMQVLGKKAPRDDMAAAAAGSVPGSTIPTSQSTKPDSMKSGLVGNIHGQDVEAAKTPI